MPLEALPAGSEGPGPAAAGMAQDGGATCWDLYVRPAGQGRIPVTFPEDVPEARYRGDPGREIAVERARYGTAVLAEREPRAVIDSHGWDGAGALLLHGSYFRPPGGGLDLVLRCPDASIEHVVACDVHGDREGRGACV